jgi:signal peptidase II
MIHFLDDHLTVTRVENSGAFLSTGDSLPLSVKQILLSLIPLIVIFLGLVYVFVKPGISNNMLIGLCFVIGGGLGNLFDRITYGSVTDFLHVKMGFFQTGVFNFADVSIMIGMSIILIQFLFRKTI